MVNAEPTKEQLQQRCLEFAGFTEMPSTAPVAIYKEPNGTITKALYLPSFTESIDAHVKWTLPKLNSMDFANTLYTGVDRSVFNIRRWTDDFIYQKYQGNGITPALAICKAIWELTEASVSRTEER